MGLIKSLRIGFFSARVASALLDIGIDVNKLHPALTEGLLQLEREGYRRTSPHETAALFLLTYMTALTSNTLLFSNSLPELVARAETILDLWVAKRKMKQEIADRYTAKLRDKLQVYVNGVAAIFHSNP